MGYNTPVLIINDALGAIERNPEQFVGGLVTACRLPMFTGHQDIQAGAHVNAASALMHRHADEYRVLVSQGNWLWEVRGTRAHEHDAHIERALAGDAFLRDELITRALAARDAANRVLDALGET